MNDRVKRESIEWCETWITAGDRPAENRVLMVGDSIVRSYYGVTERELGAGFACARFTTTKCVCDPGFAKEFAAIAGGYPWRVIHFNNGLHGEDYPEDRYAAGLRAVFQSIRRRFEGVRLIWASSTPVRLPEDLSRPAPFDARVRERNRLAAELCRRRGIPVNDLHALVARRPDCMAKDGVHFNPDGQALLGAAVAARIRQEAEAG